MEDDPIGYPAELWRQLGELDLVGLLLPEACGGSAMTLLEGVALYQELGRALAPTPALRLGRAVRGASWPPAGSDEQKERWLPPVASGEAVLTPAWLEPEGGFSPLGVQLRAVARRRGFTPQRHQAPRRLRQGGRPAGGAGPDRRRRRATSTCSWWTRRPRA